MKIGDIICVGDRSLLLTRQCDRDGTAQIVSPGAHGLALEDISDRASGRTLTIVMFDGVIYYCSMNSIRNKCKLLTPDV